MSLSSSILGQPKWWDVLVSESFFSRFDPITWFFCQIHADLSTKVRGAQNRICFSDPNLVMSIFATWISRTALWVSSGQESFWSWRLLASALASKRLSKSSSAVSSHPEQEEKRSNWIESLILNKSIISTFLVPCLEVESCCALWGPVGGELLCLKSLKVLMQRRPIPNYIFVLVHCCLIWNKQPPYLWYTKSFFIIEIWKLKSSSSEEQNRSLFACFKSIWISYKVFGMATLYPAGLSVGHFFGN